MIGYVGEGTYNIYVLSSINDLDYTVDQIQETGFFVGRFGKGETWRCSANPLGSGFSYTSVAAISVDLPCEPRTYKFKSTGIFFCFLSSAVIPREACNAQIDKIAFPGLFCLLF